MRGGRATLVLRADDAQTLTSASEADATTALVRGLADYLETLGKTAAGGRVVSLRKVVPYHAEPEEDGVLPSACVRPAGVGKYAETDLSNRIVADLGQDLRLLKSSELEVDIEVILYATDPVELGSVVGIVEDGMSPVDWLAGARLRLPRYYGVHAEYTLSSVQYERGALAVRRWRTASVVVSASVPVVRVIRVPKAHVAYRGTVLSRST